LSISGAHFLLILVFVLQRIAPMNSVPDTAALRAVRDTLQRCGPQAAAELAQRTLAAGTAHPFLYNVVALQLEADGKLLDAAASLRRGLELAPDDLGCLHALGLLLLRLEEPEEARVSFERVIDLKPDFAPAHVALGQALEAAGLLPAAEARFNGALALQPDNLLAAAGLASIAGRRGEPAAARVRARQVLAAQPNYPPAALVAAEADIALGEAAGAEAAMRSLLADPRLDVVERSLATSVLGDALDRQRREADAFAAYAESNRLRREHYAPKFGQRGTLQYARELRAWFGIHPPRDLLSLVPPEIAPSPASGHAFLIGFPRSGTTLLEQVLAAHPYVAALEERETLIDGVREFMRTPADLARLGLADEAALAPLRASYWRRVAQAGVVVDGNVFVDKHPLNGLKLPLIARLFPEARIIVAVRDPRDVVWSCFRRRFRMSAPYYELLSLTGAAQLYDAVMDLTQELIPALALRAHSVQLEALVSDFDREVAGVCGFLGIDFDPQMREFATRARGVATASGAQLARGLNAGGIGEWRRYREQLAPVLPVLERWAIRFGYEAAAGAASPIGSA
jgi:tetratricopeptide (TPR) repeat protein